MMRREPKSDNLSQVENATQNFMMSRRITEFDDYNPSPFSNSTFKMKKQNCLDLKVGTLVKGSIIGFQDIVYKRTNTVSVKCISVKGVVQMIKAHDFMQIVSKDQATMEALKIFSYEKDKELSE